MPSILVADDEDGVRQFLRRVLESAGYEVSEASDGREAMAQVRQRTFDLAIIDLVMPEQEGLETIQALKEEHSGLKIIAISGAFSDLERGTQLRMAELLGAKATLQKPLPWRWSWKRCEGCLAPERGSAAAKGRSLTVAAQCWGRQETSALGRRLGGGPGRGGGR